MKNSVFIIFVLVTAVVCDKDFIDLVATKESQNLTSPSLEGIPRPHDFKWRIRLNTTEPHHSLVITLHYLNVPETKNCNGSYLEVITGNYSFGKKCTELREEMFYGSGSYFDVIYRVGSEDGTHGFNMSYIERKDEIIVCYFPFYPGFPIWAIILIVVLVVGFIITACCCVKRSCRKRNQKVAKKQSDSSKTDKVPAFVLAGPPSYDDVIKGDNKPPPYSSVVLA